VGLYRDDNYQHYDKCVGPSWRAAQAEKERLLWRAVQNAISIYSGVSVPAGHHSVPAELKTFLRTKVLVSRGI
jgi:hypothetical protein